jgi:glycosyltransferase involved in cell wall biosynthesis
MHGDGARRHIVVDARMINRSGIGRFLRSVLDVLLESTELIMTLLGDEEELREAYPGRGMNVLPLHSSLYGIGSQFEIPRTIPPCDIFYTPHFTTTRLSVKAGKRIITIHDLFHLSRESSFSLPKRMYSRFLLSGAISASDRISADSCFTRDELVKFFPGCIDRVEVIGGCVDERVFHRDEEKPDLAGGSYVLFVGNMKPHKNLLTAASALACIGDDSLALAIVGLESGFIHGMGRDLDSLKTDPRLLFLGSVDDHELRRLYSHARCLIFPSRYEGFGLPALEAMACGCPVVCSRIPSLVEVCGEAAQFCSPLSASEFGTAIQRLVRDPGWRNELVARGLDRAKQFSRDRFEKSIRALFSMGGGDVVSSRAQHQGSTET